MKRAVPTKRNTSVQATKGLGEVFGWLFVLACDMTSNRLSAHILA